MTREQTSTTIAAFFCCLVIAHAEQNPSEELPEHTDSAVKNKAEIGIQDSRNNRFISFVKDKFAALIEDYKPRF